MKQSISFTDKIVGGELTHLDVNEIKAKSNANFTQLYDRSKGYGAKMQKFLMKLRSEEPRYKIIRVDMLGDSILSTWANSTLNNLKTYLERNYPNKTFIFTYTILGGTGSAYFQAGLWQCVNDNPDLAVIMEWEDTTMVDWLENMFKTFRRLTSSDLAVVPFSMNKTYMDLLSANNISGFIASDGQKIRNWFMSISQKYNAEFLDLHQPWIRTLLAGTETSSTLLADTIHPTQHGIDLWVEELDKHFLPTWDMEHLAYHNDGKYFKTVFFRELKEIPDFTEVTQGVGGAWAVETKNIDATIAVLKSSTAGDYVEVEFEGIGFELSHFGANVGVFKIEIGLNGGALANPNTLLKDYCTDMGGGISKFYKVIVDSNLLSNDETVINIYWEITAITRDGNDNITACTYKLRDITGTEVLIAENLNAFQDEVVTYKGGQLTLPAMYAGVQNLRDAASVMDVGFFTQFSIKKNWYNQITQSVNNLTNVTRLFGLPRGKHKVRLTVVSGTVNLDSIMELK